MIKNIYCPSCKLHVILVRLERNLNFLDRISKNTQISNFVQICSVGAHLFRADGRTGGRTDRHDVANCRLSRFCELA